MTGELEQNQTVLNALIKTATTDLATSFTPTQSRETPTFLAQNGGDQITLEDSTAASHYAILWAGFTDRLRHFDNINNMIASLERQWANTVFTINVLYGDGMHVTIGGGQYNTITAGVDMWKTLPGVTVQAATLANLTATVQNVAKNLSPTAEFLFYASDHGGFRLPELLPAPRVVLGNAHDLENFVLTDGELQGLRLQQQFGATAPNPSLTINYSGLTTTATVTLNGVLLGSLDPTNDTTTLQVPEDILLSDNTIDIFNSGLGSFTLEDKIFDSGGIDDNPVPTVPLPPSALLLGSGLIGLAGLKRFRKS